MSALVTSNPDNANPTVYSRPSGGSKRLVDFLDDDMFQAGGSGLSSDASEEDEPQMIWSSQRNGSDSSSEDDEEPIDQQEIFGESCNVRNGGLDRMLILWQLQTSSAPSQTQSTLSHSSSWPS